MLAEILRVFAALAQGERFEALAALAHDLQHLRRRRQFRIGHLRPLRCQRRRVGFAAARAVEQCRGVGDSFEQLVRPDLQFHRLAAALQLQARPPAFLDHGEEVVGGVAALAVQQRAVAERAEQQEGVEEARLVQVDAQRQERVDVQAAHFHVLHAASGQGLHRRSPV